MMVTVVVVFEGADCGGGDVKWQPQSASDVVCYGGTVMAVW